MRVVIYLLLISILFSCSKTEDLSVANYFKHINKAELAICNEDFETAVSEFEIAFSNLKKPFGKDVFNAALSSQLIKNYKKRNDFLQQIINNSDELFYVKSEFVSHYMSEEEWQDLISKREIKYMNHLRVEFNEIQRRDQLFRPMYDTHDDTINANRKINLKRIIDLTNLSGFPSHVELGYSSHLRKQPHDIVLHHTAQRRGREGSAMDLEPLLDLAVKQGRFDPEKAIEYLNYQNDAEKGYFEVYTSWQFSHALLPDSLTNKVWFSKLDKKHHQEANELRAKWYANSLEDIAIKVNFLTKSNLPFIFSSVKKSFGNFPADFDYKTALEQYDKITGQMEEYKR